MQLEPGLSAATSENYVITTKKEGPQVPEEIVIEEMSRDSICGVY
jgi:mycofactocin precursor